ncbi:acyl-CoA carboxylase epsilon subunit [Streptomyces sp. NPDC058534]|uniref:acyl-CoA carboxylase epsilon subunit n=1 Tax=Streptomyces sp. NPDC058534 TaxID=3346541 RepID=UPI0036530FCB
MSELKVVHGKPSDEDLAALVAVLLAVGQPDTAAAAGRGADGTPGAPGRPGWAHARRFLEVPAGSWQYV